MPVADHATRTTWRDRAASAMKAMQRLEILGLNVPEATQADSEEYVAGQIDADELVRRARWVCQR